METHRGDPGHMEQYLQDLFGPDLVLPEQFYPSRFQGGALSGERALMWAVLADGIECFRRTAYSFAQRDAEEYREAEAWIMATDWESVFSFANLCEVFGFDPACLRRALMRWRKTSALGKRQRFRPVALRAA